ncbi:MAG: flagellar biosynthesis protein FlhB [Asticcacaulis sp.]
MAEGSEEDKTEDPSARKLQQARQDGDVPKSPELPQALTLIGACALIALKGPDVCMTLAAALMPFIAHPQQLLNSLRGDGGLTIARDIGMAVLPVMIMILGVTMVLGVAGNVLQTGIMFVPKKLMPSFDKLNPMKGFQRMFGIDAYITFGKTLLKLIITAVVVYMVMHGRITDVLKLSQASPLLILPYAREAFIALAMAVCIFLFAGAGADYLIQRFRFMQKMRMSKQELKEEFKQTEGDPHVKAKLRQLRMEKSRRRMMANVARATVVVTNPTHYAVALRYEKGETAAPVCVAKGMDDIALKIREEAGKHEVPIVEDPPLARALYAAVELDEVIPEAHFAAVAKLISFILTRKRRGF